MLLPSKKKGAGSSVDVFCKTCWKDVSAAVVQADKKAKPPPFPSLVAAIPYAMGNLAEIRTFNFSRILVYFVIFLQFGGNMDLCLCNPYVLLLLSTLFVILLYLITRFMPQFVSLLALKRLYTAKLFAFGVLPLVVIELLLANVNPMFIIIDLAIGLMLLTSIKKRRGN